MSHSPDENSDDLMREAYGESLHQSEAVHETSWYQSWVSVTRLNGRLYNIPGGAFGLRYVDHLTIELSHFSAGNYPSERLIVFSLILQRDRMVRKGSDVRQVIEKRLA